MYSIYRANPKYYALPSRSALADIDIDVDGTVRAEPIEGSGPEQIVRGEEQEDGVPGPGGVEEPTAHGHRHEARQTGECVADSKHSPKSCSSR